MTEENLYYENTMDERVNGILKNKFYLDQTFDRIAYANCVVKNVIKLYKSDKITLIFKF